MNNDTEVSLELRAAEIEFILEWEEGKNPTVEQFVAAYPQFARQIASFILEFVELEARVVRIDDCISPHTTRGIDHALSDIMPQPLDLAHARRLAGLTQGNLASALSLPLTIVRKLEQGGIVGIPHRFFEIVAKTLNRPIDQIIRAATSTPPRSATALRSLDDVGSKAPQQTFHKALSEAVARGQMSGEQAAAWQNDKDR